jgi:hypothetical protein
MLSSFKKHTKRLQLSVLEKTDISLPKWMISEFISSVKVVKVSEVLRRVGICLRNLLHMLTVAGVCFKPEEVKTWQLER